MVRLPVAESTHRRTKVSLSVIEATKTTREQPALRRSAMGQASANASPRGLRKRRGSRRDSQKKRAGSLRPSIDSEIRSQCLRSRSEELSPCSDDRPGESVPCREPRFFSRSRSVDFSELPPASLLPVSRLGSEYDFLSVTLALLSGVNPVNTRGPIAPHFPGARSVPANYLKTGGFHFSGGRDLRMSARRDAVAPPAAGAWSGAGAVEPHEAASEASRCATSPRGRRWRLQAGG
jgi:hypothetical protein